MKIYAMSDMHGHLLEFNCALLLIEKKLEEPDTKLVLLGDYIHGGPDSYGVLDRIMELQRKYGSQKVVALLGNHEDMVLMDLCAIGSEHSYYRHGEREADMQYIHWMRGLPRSYEAGDTIFVHAGIDEDAGEYWKECSDECLFTEKFPAQTGKFQGGQKIVAGHIGTASISADPEYHDIFFDGESHYYIDGTVRQSGVIPVLKVDTATDKYYRVTENGDWPILPYSEEN